MKNIFLTDKPENIRNVYGNIAGVKSVDLDYDNCFTGAQIKKNADKFTDTECIFSTWYMPILSEREIHKYFPSLKAVFYAAGTVKYFAEPYIKNGIKVFSADTANAVAAAEFSAAEILLANKGFYKSALMYKKHKFKKARSFAALHFGNYGANIGILGVGKVGRSVIDRLKNHDLKIYAYDKYISDTDISSMGAIPAGMKEIFSVCNVISNHLPDTDETRNIIDYDCFCAMRDYATFINTGRGRTVDESAMIKVMKKRTDLTAVLDVTCHEPLFFTSSVYRMNNIFITPHIAGSIGSERLRMAEYMFDAYRNFIQGKDDESEVTAEMLEKMCYDR